MQGDKSADADDIIEHIKAVHREISEKLKISVVGYKEAADQRWREHEFNVGDLVIVYFRREMFPTGSYNKLSRRKFGPYPILKRLGSNAYNLLHDVPTSPIFNMSKLY